MAGIIDANNYSVRLNGAYIVHYGTVDIFEGSSIIILSGLYDTTTLFQYLRDLIWETVKEHHKKVIGGKDNLCIRYITHLGKARTCSHKEQ